MSEILSIEQLKEMANPIIQIPDFEGTGYINIRVQRPKLLKMAEEGKIPNHLIDIAATLISGKPKNNKMEVSSEEYVKQINLVMEMYCRACMIEPTFEEFKDIITDEQKATIADWAMKEVSGLDSFRTNKAYGTNNNDSKEV